MAIEFCTSPRISFSHDLIQSDGQGCGSSGIPADCHRSDSTLLDPSPDFDFFAFGRPEQESFPADELFSDGKLLPLQLKRLEIPVSAPESNVEPPPPPIPPPSPLSDRKKESLRDIMAAERPDGTENSETAEKPKPEVSRSFWRFRRSISFNGGNSGHKYGSIWGSFQILSRSKSTGSVDPTPKNSHPKETHFPKSSSVKKPPSTSSNSKSLPPSPSHSPSSPLQKPPLKKTVSAGRTRYGSCGNGVRISPILNVPPPYISKGTASLFGFGYLLSPRKDRKLKKKSS